MYWSILILLCIKNVMSTDSSLLIQQYPDQRTFDCALNILNSATNISILIVHFNEENINYLLTKLRPDYTLFNLHKNETTSYKIDQHKYAIYLIIIQRVEELNIVYKLLNLYPGGKVIVLNLGNNTSAEFFQTAWTKYIINLSIVHISTGTSYIDSYFPYENSNCGKNISATSLGRCQNLSLHAMFPNKVPPVLPGCEIRVVANLAEPFVMDANLTVEDSRVIGKEAVVFKNILERMNLTQKLIASPYLTISYVFANGTIVGPHTYLAEGKCDLFYGQKWTAHFYSDLFDSTYTHYMEPFTWHVPLAEPGQQWTNILLAFDYTLWLGVLVMLLCMILVVWLFALVSVQPGSYASWGWCCLNVWYTLLMGSVPLPRAASLKILVYFWTIYALILTTSYQSQLLSFLMKPVYEHQISTVDELLSSSLEIPLVENFIRSLKNSGSSTDMAILKKGYVVRVDEIKDLWLNGVKNAALLAGTSYAKYVAWKQQYTYDIKPSTYMFKQLSYSLKLTLHTVKGFPLIERMNDIILRSAAAGLNEKWQRDIEPTPVAEENELRVLTVEDTRGAFIILGLGCGTALVSFIFEIVIYKVKINVY